MIYDITRPITPSLAVWPGDTPFDKQFAMRIADGESVNVTTLTMSSHMGTHVDAPYHFVDDAPPLEQVALTPFIGPATVITVTKAAGPLTPADLPGLDWSQVERLLIHSPASHKPLDKFAEDYVYPSPELANWLAGHGVILFGTDAPSVDDMNSKELPGHHALRRNRIDILEGLLLDGVPDGPYELIALPLKIVGGDGSPVRAILRS
ncbi:MAG: cyclase family protein [Anaerolineae bacterium]|nr:cyclase family protein [Anaerolineae bacterium]MCB0178416.1 cyclase family protein [Anaerolineae bacterium]MCB9106811.1 cyclase family protein [Anaerolineales bacterium]